MTDSLNAALRDVALFVPKLLAFLVLFVIGLIVARLIAKAVTKVLERIGFDRVLERGGVTKFLAKGDQTGAGIVGKVVYYALLLFVLQLAFGVFGPNPISDLITGVIAFLPKAIVAVIIVVVTIAIANAVRDLITAALGALSYGKVLAGIAAAFILGLGVIAALNQVGIATTVTLPVLITVLATVSGILIVGVGGGLIKPMQARWEGYLSAAEQEAPKLKNAAGKAPGVNESGRQAEDDRHTGDAQEHGTATTVIGSQAGSEQAGETGYPEGGATRY